MVASLHLPGALWHRVFYWLHCSVSPPMAQVIVWTGPKPELLGVGECDMGDIRHLAPTPHFTDEDAEPRPLPRAGHCL